MILASSNQGYRLPHSQPAAEIISLSHNLEEQVDWKPFSGTGPTWVICSVLDLLDLPLEKEVRSVFPEAYELKWERMDT